MYQDSFKSLNHVSGMVRLIPNQDVLESFKWMNIERIKPLFIPKAFVKRTDKGNYCSNCDYSFQGEEENYYYCVSCLEELACCDDEYCDKDNQRAEESAISFLEESFRKN
ncbi:MAG: hypothetical protein ABIJ14_03345 [Nanoarchaeota archaeon]